MRAPFGNSATTSVCAAALPPPLKTREPSPPTTAARAMSVVAPEITISQRTFATMRAAAGSSG